ncbi:MAG: hypothetical protein ACYDCH_01360 [Gaiellaceae bacterium]
MRIVRLGILFAAVAALGAGATSARSGVTAPTGLHAFLLRADEAAQTTFSRTPSFAWNPVPGADHYEFQLSLSGTFRDNAILWLDADAPTPVEAPPLVLPWITGSPHSLYARVRAIVHGGATPWSEGFGFDMAPPPPPTPLSSYPGLLRWTPVDGALAYQVWLTDAHKFETVSTNVLDERDFYTFHTSAQWTASIHWRIRALRAASASGAALNGIKPVTYGAWSPVYTSTNPAFAAGPISLVGTVSDVFSNGDPSSPAHRLMPGFLWSGNTAFDGSTAELYRVYVFTDKQCLNRVFTSAVVGSPAYAPRAKGPLALPTTLLAVAGARSTYLQDGAEPSGFTYDGSPVATTESLPPTTPTVAVPGSSGGAIAWSDATGAPTDLWDTGWPASGYYWTVVPVAAVSPGALSTSVGSPGAPAGATSIPVTSTSGFGGGDVVTIGSGPTAESATVTGISGGSLLLAGKLASGHGAGEPLDRAGGSLQYQDLELPQDVCAAGRIERFGKQSAPSLTSAGNLFATGLSATGRLTSAVHTTRFYGEPLVSWQPALGAETYEVQWSRASYPFTPQPDPSTGALGRMTTSTATVLPVGPGTWYYRVRGFDYSLPSGSQQMTWSHPAKLLVAAPRFSVTVAPAKKFRRTK